MNEEIEYAEMLEIPVSTVNVIRKNKKRRHVEQQETLKERTISLVNETANLTEGEPLDADALPYFSETLENNETDYASQKGREELARFMPKISRKERIQSLVLKAEFGLACALCTGIFLTNVWMPSSAINTFFRSLVPEKQTVDGRDYTDFTLSNVVGSGSETEMTLSPTGILTFVQEGCVYPTADGKVSAVTQDENGKFTVKISHTDTFSGVIEGLDYVYYSVGQTVKHNVPVGYSDGENEVQVTLYSGDELLNCFAVTEENGLEWVSSSK
jgi:hypothetical protein